MTTLPAEEGPSAGGDQAAHDAPVRIDPVRHRRRTAWMLGETLVVYALLVAGAEWAAALPGSTAIAASAAVLFAQALWLDRLYVVGHEAAHKKLLPGSRAWNDALGSLFLLPLVVPLDVLRKIHMFHHGYNRRDPRTSALEVFVVHGPAGHARRALAHALWLGGVFAGGFFLHSVVSLLAVLCLPVRRAVRVSPAFRGWNARLRLRSWLMVGVAVAVQVLVAWVFGGAVWRRTFLWPLVAFAWLWSLLLYVFHYRAPVGPRVRHNVRSLPRVPLLSWVLLNFNEHATHHRHPGVPWYDLPRWSVGRAAGAESWLGAVLGQLRGATIVELPADDARGSP